MAKTETKGKAKQAKDKARRKIRRKLSRKDYEKEIAPAADRSSAWCRTGSRRRGSGSSSSSRAAMPPARAAPSGPSRSAAARASSAFVPCPRPRTARNPRCTSSATCRISRRPARSSSSTAATTTGPGSSRCWDSAPKTSSRIPQPLPGLREDHGRQRYPADQILARGEGRASRSGASRPASRIPCGSGS